MMHWCKSHVINFLITIEINISSLVMLERETYTVVSSVEAVVSSKAGNRQANWPYVDQSIHTE